MTDAMWCASGMLAALVGLFLIIRLIQKFPRPRLFDGMGDVFVQWRAARDLAEKLLVLLVLFIMLVVRGGAWGIAIAIVTASVTIGTSLCGTSPESLRGLRDILSDVLSFLRDCFGLPQRFRSSLDMGSVWCRIE